MDTGERSSFQEMLEDLLDKKHFLCELQIGLVPHEEAYSLLYPVLLITKSSCTGTEYDLLRRCLYSWLQSAQRSWLAWFELALQRGGEELFTLEDLQHFTMAICEIDSYKSLDLTRYLLAKLWQEGNIAGKIHNLDQYGACLCHDAIGGIATRAA